MEAEKEIVRSRNIGFSPVVQRVIEEIDQRIRDGSMVAGQRLVEFELVDQLGVGRTVVREALRVLAGDGVVELIPNKGARIRQLSRKALVDMLQTCAGLYSTGIYLLAGRNPDRAAASLWAACDEIDKHADAERHFELISSVFDYHNIVNKYSDNEYLIEICAHVHVSHYSREITKFTPVGYSISSARSYREVTRLILEGKGVEAVSIIICDLAKITNRHSETMRDPKDVP